MLRFYPVDEHVAFGSMPSGREIVEAAALFDVIVAVVEEHELEYDPAWLEGRARFVHVPVPDYRWPRLGQLLSTVRLVAEEAEKGAKVLIHCLGGIGRSATMAAGYLVYRYRVPARRAVEYVRSLRPGAVEHPGQEGVLRAAEAVLAAGIEPGVGDGEEYLRVAGMLAEALAAARVAGLHAVGEVLRGVGRGARVLARLRAMGEDLAKVALLDLEERGPGEYLLRPVLVGYGEVVEAELPTLAEELKKAFPFTARKVVAAEPEYW